MDRSQPTIDPEILSLLTRIEIDDEGNLLRVWDTQQKHVIFQNDPETNPIRPCGEERFQLFQALQKSPQELEIIANQLVQEASSFPAKQELALLGLIAGCLFWKNELHRRVEKYMLELMEKSFSLTAKTQAVRTLAMLPAISSETAKRVGQFFQQHGTIVCNGFAVLQFVDQHRDNLKKMPNFSEFLEAIAQAPSLFSNYMLRLLGNGTSPEPST